MVTELMNDMTPPRFVPGTRAKPQAAARSGRLRLSALHALVLLLIAITLVGCSASTATPDTDTQRVTINDRVFNLELALDNDTRYTGLSHRESIAPDGGMLFVFPYARQTHFVMRDCLVPIDLIFLGPKGEIIAMHQMQVEPEETRDEPRRWYPSQKNAQFAIELKGGTLDELDLKRGDRIDLPLDDLKARAR